MLDSIVGPSYTNTTTEDDVFGSIIGYMAPVPVVPLTVAPMLKQPEQQGIDEVVVAPKDSPWAAQGESLGGGQVVPEKVSYADAQIQEIEVTKIVPNPFQPRKIFDPEGLKELAESIREHGVIQPLVVTQTEAGYELVVGERRFRASILAGLIKVPAIVKKSLEDQTKLEVALIENIQRRELNAIEEARAYDRLIKTFNLTQEQVAQKVGKSRPSVTNTLRLLNLPVEVQRAVIEGKVSEGHARALLAVVEPERQLALFRTMLEQGWNVRQVEAKARELSAKKMVDSAAPDPKLMAIETELRSRLGTQVKVQRQGRGGKITIDFFSDEDLQDIVSKLEHAESGALSSPNATPYFTV
ncbi:MAG: ParB/RepB/Spo0J family partition protein [Candidatus Doudnabacteria bacterium]|nr:ParB/RepB/Spo0J family partition protein [Candidatus Doudnabacteria bacterium]